MNDEMLETQNDYAVLKELEENIFVRFIEWAYQGYYIPERYVHRLSDVSSSVRSVVEENDRSETCIESPFYTSTTVEESSVEESSVLAPVEEYIVPRPNHMGRRRSVE